jgi:hypothetical protein
MTEQEKRARRYKKTKKNRVNAWLEGQYKKTPCMDCAEVFPFCAMDFDHRPGEIKSFTIGSRGTALATDHRRQRIMEEINKCDYVCACCHRVRTKERIHV